MKDKICFPVLDDKGFVRLVDYMGSDMSVVNAARVSFRNHKELDEPLDDRDRVLIRYLATHEHTSPFRHAFLTLHIKCPLFVKGQFDKHQVGVSINTVSGRYVEWQDGDYYVPEVFRKQAKVNKQGSEGQVEDNQVVHELYDKVCQESFKVYEDLLAKGVCREQARAILPQGIYTEFYMSMSLQALAHFIRLRTDSHAQWETQQYAKVIQEIGLTLFPNSLQALLKLDLEQND